jgi:hypothetical protein
VRRRLRLRGHLGSTAADRAHFNRSADPEHGDDQHYDDANHQFDRRLGLGQ